MPQGIIRNQTPWPALLLGLVPLGLFMGIEQILASYGDLSVNLGEITWNAFAAQAELAGRYRVFAAVLFYCMVCAGVTVIVALDLWASHTLRSRLRLFGLWAFLGAVYLALSLEFDVDPTKFEMFALIDGPVFREALALGRVSDCGPGCAMTALDIFHGLGRISNIATAFGATAAVTAMISTISEPRTFPHSDVLDPETEAAHLRSCAASGKRFITLAGAVLSAGILSFTAWSHWPLGMLTGDQKEVLTQIARALTLFTGVTYSMLILSYFLPSAALLSRKAQQLAEASCKANDLVVTTDELTKWRKANDLAASPLDALKVMIATTSPILASTIGGIPAFPGL